MPPRPNTTVLFPIFNDLVPQLSESPSPFNILAWQELLRQYPGSLLDTLANILTYGTLLGYEGLNQQIIS